MLFSYNRVLLAAITAFAFLQLVFAIPVPILTAEHSAVGNEEIAGFGLSGKAAKDMKNWHENHVINAMKTNPNLNGAHHAVVHHTAHKGGHDPEEMNHITASFYDKHGAIIPNNFNGGPNHHVYVPKSNAGLGKEGKKALQRANVALRQRQRH
jgi:hypothetical protein